MAKRPNRSADAKPLPKSAAPDPFEPAPAAITTADEQQSTMHIPDCPRCSEGTKRFKCDIRTDGLIFRFVCPNADCSFDIPGPPNVEMTTEYNRRQADEHEQHIVRDHQQ